ncbi:MAG: hypothetical protein ACQETI_07365 [Halobacteriota archaeon]
MASISVVTAESVETYDAVIVKNRTVVCLRSDTNLARVLPLDEVESIDADADLVLTDIPESFFGGAEFGFVEVDRFPAIQRHLDELAQEVY